MTNTYYSCLTGMLAASFGLQNTSNNVANMQSNGFKRNDLFYSSLGNEQKCPSSGVHVRGQAINFANGKYLKTDNATDLAVIGNGFFIIKIKANEFIYTRAGEFYFDQGILKDRRSGGTVQGIDSRGQLCSVQETGPKTLPGKPSRNLYIQGKLVPKQIENAPDNSPTNPLPNPEPTIPGNPMEQKPAYENMRFQVENVYDAHGKAHTITIELKNTPDSVDPNKECYWELEHIECEGMQLHYVPGQKITLSPYQYGAFEGANTLTFNFLGEQTTRVHLGSLHDSADTGVQIETKAPGEQTISTYSNDGYAIGNQYGYSFTEEGQIIYHYDNQQNSQGIYVGLALIRHKEQDLLPYHENYFKTKSNAHIEFDRANQQGLGTIQAGQIESSNVDATMEFANIVVLQRMFQACSQIMDIEKELIQQLESGT